MAKNFETLIGGIVEKKINPNITYSDLTKNETNLWSVLYMTGYLMILFGSLTKMASLNTNKVKGLYKFPIGVC